MTRKPRVIPLNNKCGHSFGACRGVSFGIDNIGVGIWTIGDPHLVAVENVLVALFVGSKFHTHYIRTGVGFTHGQRTDMFT